MDQEEDFISKDYQIYPFSLPEQEKSDEFIKEDMEEEDIQSSEPLKAFYREDKRQDKETVHSLSSTTELDDQLIRAKHFTELDIGITRGNPWVKKINPYPTRQKPL